MTKKITNTAMVLTVLAATTMANAGTGELVRSKSGDLDLFTKPKSEKVECTASYEEQMKLLEQKAQWSLVKAFHCNGWTENAKIEKVKQAGDKNVVIKTIEVERWLSDPGDVFVLGADAAEWGGIEINRDFKDHLVYTMDRERTEMRNMEN